MTKTSILISLILLNSYLGRLGHGLTLFMVRICQRQGTNKLLRVIPYPKQCTQRARPNNQDAIKPCVLCNQMHRLFGCSAFKGMTPAARLELVKDKKLCFNCLLPFHTAHTCYKQPVCSVPGCGKKHTKFVHVDTNIDDIPVDSVVDRGSPIPDNVVNMSNTNALGTNVYDFGL